MSTIIRNKIKIIPNAYSSEEYNKQIANVAEFCSLNNNGVTENISFEKIAPKPVGFKLESKEEDDWLLNNWGTRFKPLNACWINDEEMIFDTFWNPSLPIIRKIIKQFPNTDFEFKFASKRTGIKTGELNGSDGRIVYFKKFDNFSKEAYDTAFELMPHLRMFYTLNQKTGTYEYDVSDFISSIEQKGYYRESDGTVLIGSDDKRKPLFDSLDELPF